MSKQSQLDYDHIREKQKELQEKEKYWEEQKELQRQLKVDLDEKQKELQMLNNEIKTKQMLLKKMNAQPIVPQGQGSSASNGNMQDELEIRNKQIEMLNDRLLVQDHELRELRALQSSMEQLKRLEMDLDKKDGVISELKKKIMIQEEAISEWISAMDEKKKLLIDKDKRCNQLEEENGSLMKKNVEYRDQTEVMQTEISNLKPQNDKLQLENQSLIEAQEKIEKDALAKEQSLRELLEIQDKDLEDKDTFIQNLEAQLLSVRQTKQEEIEALVLEKDQLTQKWTLKESSFIKQVKSLEEQLMQLQKEYDKYREDRELEDLLVVKLDVNTIDEQMLSNQETKIEDLMDEKAKLEAKIQQLSQEYNLVLTDKSSLAEKIHLFQTRIGSLESQLKTSKESYDDQLRTLKREHILIQDQLGNANQTVTDLQKQLEELLQSKKEEISKLKKDSESQIQKERERANGVEKQFKRMLQEKEILENKLKEFYTNLEKVEEKMSQKQVEIQGHLATKEKMSKQLEELRAIIQKQKKQEQQDSQEVETKFKDKEAEMQVLKEMIKGIKLQLKCKFQLNQWLLAKDTDIQRLMIKVKRLEKTNELRDNVLQEVNKQNAKPHNYLQHSQQQQDDFDSQPSKILVEDKGNHSFVLPPISGGNLNNQSIISKNSIPKSSGRHQSTKQPNNHLRKQANPYYPSSQNDRSVIQEPLQHTPSLRSLGKNKSNESRQSYRQGNKPAITKRQSNDRMNEFVENEDYGINLTPQIVVNQTNANNHLRKGSYQDEQSMMDDFMEQQKKLMKQLDNLNL